MRALSVLIIALAGGLTSSPPVPLSAMRRGGTITQSSSGGEDYLSNYSGMI